MKKNAAPALKKVASKLAKVELFCEVGEILPEIKNPKKREKVMQILLKDLKDETSQYILSQVYLKLNDSPLTQEIVDDAINNASLLAYPSKIKNSYILDENGNKVSVKDVYRIAYHLLGFDISNADFNTHAAVEELKFFTPIYRVVGKKVSPHFMTVVE